MRTIGANSSPHTLGLLKVRQKLTNGGRIYFNATQHVICHTSATNYQLFLGWHNFTTTQQAIYIWRAFGTGLYLTVFAGIMPEKLPYLKYQGLGLVAGFTTFELPPGPGPLLTP